jgi:hypothetical protein
MLGRPRQLGTKFFLLCPYSTSQPSWSSSSLSLWLDWHHIYTHTHSHSPASLMVFHIRGNTTPTGSIEKDLCSLAFPRAYSHQLRSHAFFFAQVCGYESTLTIQAKDNNTCQLSLSLCFSPVVIRGFICPAHQPFLFCDTPNAHPRITEIQYCRVFFFFQEFETFWNVLCGGPLLVYMLPRCDINTRSIIFAFITWLRLKNSSAVKFFFKWRNKWCDPVEKTEGNVLSVVGKQNKIKGKRRRRRREDAGVDGRKCIKSSNGPPSREYIEDESLREEHRRSILFFCQMVIVTLSWLAGLVCWIITETVVFLCIRHTPKHTHKSKNNGILCCTPNLLYFFTSPFVLFFNPFTNFCLVYSFF